MSRPSDLRYTESHEWFRLEGEIATVGITQYAANELTDVTYVEMRGAGTSVTAGEALGEVESVKTTSDVYAIVGGEITDVNQAVADDPSLINTDPYGSGWLVKLRISDAGPIEALMDEAAYDGKYAVD